MDKYSTLIFALFVLQETIGYTFCLLMKKKLNLNIKLPHGKYVQMFLYLPSKPTQS